MDTVSPNIRRHVLYRECGWLLIVGRRTFVESMDGQHTPVSRRRAAYLLAASRSRELGYVAVNPSMALRLMGAVS